MAQDKVVYEQTYSYTAEQCKNALGKERERYEKIIDVLCNFLQEASHQPYIPHNVFIKGLTAEEWRELAERRATREL